jgi:hypothetical protein
MKKQKTINIAITITIILTTIFFAIYKILNIPPGTQDDVLRSIITAEQNLTGNNGGITSIRQTIAYFILGGYWTTLLTNILRGIPNVTLMLILSRLPAALFFIFGSITWLKTLRLLKLKNFGIIIFYLIFLPSAFFITYSHHIPLVAGYFFFGSVGIHYLIKFFASEEVKYRNLLFATLAFAISTYTHAISSFFLISFVPLFLILILLLKPQLIKKFLKSTYLDSKKNLGKYIVVIIFFILSLVPVVHGIVSSDLSIQTRQANTITYLIDYNEIDLMWEKMKDKYLSYFHPNTLVVSGDITEGKQEVNSDQFYDIKNAYYNQWVTTNISPFGFISAFVYFGIFYVIIQMFRKKDLKYILAFTLFFSYLFVIFPTNYDNPSIAKVIVPIMFIPLTVTIFLSDIVKLSKLKFLKIIILLISLLNAGYNLFYLYSDDLYTNNETAKYYVFNYDEVLDEILKTPDLSKTRIYISTTDQGTKNIFQYYLGTYGLNRMVFGDIKPDIIDPQEYNYIITRNPDNVETVLEEYGYEYSTTLYMENDNVLPIYLTRISRQEETQEDISLINITDTVCYKEPYSPIRMGEYEYVYSHQRLYPYTFSTEKCIDGQREIETFDPYTLAENVEIPNPDQKIDYTIEKVNNVGIEDSSNINLLADIDPAKVLIKVSNINSDHNVKPGTYLLSFDYNIDEFGYIDFFTMYANNLKVVPVNILPQEYDPNYTGQYTSLMYLPQNQEIVITAELQNNHFNINKDLHPVRAQLTNLQIQYVAEEDLLGLDRPEISSDVKSISLDTEMIIPGIFRINNSEVIKENTLIHINKPYNPFYKALGAKSSNYIVNGITNGLKIDGEVQGDLIIVDMSLVYGLGIFIIWSTILLIITLGLEKKKN